MCWKCGKNIETSENIFRNSTCGYCGTDLHSCKNCKFYEPGRHYDCNETVEEIIVDKERSNFCDYFKAKNTFSKTNNSDSAAKAKDAFLKLFGD